MDPIEAGPPRVVVIEPLFARAAWKTSTRTEFVDPSTRASATPLDTLRTRIARQVTLGKQRYRLALELHIEDNGPGVPEDIRDRIFFPLVSGREGGSGLGLTLAQTFVQQHMGHIECESVPGRTVFSIVIPLP